MMGKRINAREGSFVCTECARLIVMRVAKAVSLSPHTTNSLSHGVSTFSCFPNTIMGSEKARV